MRSLRSCKELLVGDLYSVQHLSARTDKKMGFTDDKWCPRRVDYFDGASVYENLDEKILCRADAYCERQVADHRALRRLGKDLTKGRVRK